MKVQGARWKRLGMLAVLGMVVYQGLLCTTRLEVSQKLQELGYSRDRVHDAEISYRAHGNVAPFYEAAARLQNGTFHGSNRTVSMEDFRQNRDGAERQLAGQQLAFDLLRRASGQSRCVFASAQMCGEPNFLGYRSLTRTVCLEMMRLAEQGRIEEAVAMARDAIIMLERLEESPTAIQHSVCLSLAEQLTSTAQELCAAYPGQGFESLAPDLARLGRALERGLARCPSFERDVVVGEFDKIWQGDDSGPGGPSGFTLALDLQLAQAELAYLQASQQAEQALRDGDDDRLLATVVDLKRHNKVAATMMVSWPTLAKRHREVLKGLRPNS